MEIKHKGIGLSFYHEIPVDPDEETPIINGRVNSDSFVLGFSVGDKSVSIGTRDEVKKLLDGLLEFVNTADEMFPELPF